ncbi:hypothetical protein [Noviherbaspirillum pedocola]|uniref:Uncharacterized protein n=1 Tax=Noviherbaspirillum pedocola TaxID=2801341 RepID=A0A934T0B6_9BURK|nr:hypothetical protein [Noviherbaspirillum pedocola]MBK4736124.1 hypothetical protein [Noviherbaspirillum pedocola]
MPYPIPIPLRERERVAYEVGHAQYGYGRVLSRDEHTDMLTVLDEEDGSIWRGPADRCCAVGDGL